MGGTVLGAQLGQDSCQTLSPCDSSFSLYPQWDWGLFWDRDEI